MAITAAVSIKLDGMAPDDAGIKTPDTRFLTFGSVVAVVLVSVVATFVLLAGRFPPLYRSEPHPLLNEVFWIGAFCPVAEELFFRGWFQTAVKRALGNAPKQIIVISATVFALMHIFWIVRGAPASTTCVVVLAAFVTGLFFARSREQSGSILPPILLHSLYNLTGVLIGVGLRWMIAAP